MEISSNPFLEEDIANDSVASTAAPTNPGLLTDRISYEEISKQLINDSFVLTALELHTELQEIGKPVAYLRDYFSNPGNFERTKAPELQSTSPPVGLQRSGSIQTFDSLDWARYSDDGDRQVEDRVAGLEFELRKAQDTIKSLRKALTIATEKDTVTSEDQGADDDTSKAATDGSHDPVVIKPHEKRAINFLVNEYLLIHDYKLTSVTFAEENENQDFEYWDDVGLNISKPPDLLHLYLDFGKHTAPITDVCDAQTAVNFYQPEIDVLKHQYEQVFNEKEDKAAEVSTLTMERESLNTDIELLRLQNTQLEDRLAEMQSSADAALTDLQNTKGNSSDCTDSIPKSAVRQLHSYQSIDRDIPHRFLEKILSLSFHVPDDNRIAQQVYSIDGNNTNTIVETIAQSLTHIVPNVLLAKREELLPLILCAANLHPSAKSRDSLLNTLFNLIKRPDELQRQMILTGCIMFAQYNGPQKVEEELLPQCWEQIGDKYMERRLLVVDACSALIPYMSSSIRGSLVLSMLQQMLLDERIEEIRCSIVRCLAILVCFIDDNDKFQQVLTLYSRNIFRDTSQSVQDVTVDVLLPALAQWALTINMLSHITDDLFTALKNSLTEPNEENEIYVIPESFLPAIRHLHTLVNFQFVSLLYSGPYVKSANIDTEATNQRNGLAKDADPSALEYLVSSPAQHAELLKLYNEYTSEEWYKTWDEFDLLVYSSFSHLFMIALSMPVDNIGVIQSLVDYASTICKTVGQRVTKDKIVPKMSDFFKLDEEITSQHHKIYMSALLPLLICGIRAAHVSDSDDNVHELISYVKSFIIKMSDGRVPLTALDVSVLILLGDECLTEPLLDCLIELINHTTTAVRVNTAHLLKTAIACSSCTSYISSKILPVLCSLVQDTDVIVRSSVIAPLGSVLENCSSREVLETVYAEFIKLSEDVHQTRDINMLLELIITYSHVGPKTEPQFRENVIIPHLTVWAHENNKCGDTIRRRDVSLALVSAYSDLTCCFISQRVSHESFLPGLRALLTDIRELGLDGAACIQTLISEFEAKLGANSNSLAPGSHAAAMPSPSMGRSGNKSGGSGSVLNKLSRDLFSKRK